MKNSSLIVGLLYSFFSYCQNNIIEYKAIINKSNIIGVETINDYPDIESNLNLVNLFLAYNENEMKFYFNKSSAFKNDDTEITMLIADIQGVYYRKNKLSDIFVSISKYGNQENFIVKKKFITDWNITNEKKIICGYECIKATCNLKIDYGDNEVNTLYPITAWYCAQLKNSYGPKGYGGLPGLILEIEQNLIIYTAVKINSEMSSEIIAIPSDVKIITEAKMYDLFEKSTNESK